MAKSREIQLWYSDPKTKTMWWSKWFWHNKRQHKITFGIKYFTLINNRIVLRTNKKKKSTNKPRLLPNFVQNNYNDLHIQSLLWDSHDEKCDWQNMNCGFFQNRKKTSTKRNQIGLALKLNPNCRSSPVISADTDSWQKPDNTHNNLNADTTCSLH